MAKDPGRPSKFNDALKEVMLVLYKKGKTDKQVAEIVGVTERTIHSWKGKHPSFLHALRESKQIADDLVEASLFSRATGFAHGEEKVFCHNGQIITHDSVKQYPPDTTAAIFWLKNRQPDKWRDKTEIDLNDLREKSDDELDARIAALMPKQPKEK